jgi:hypothetical protein
MITNITAMSCFVMLVTKRLWCNHIMVNQVLYISEWRVDGVQRLARRLLNRVSLDLKLRVNTCKAGLLKTVNYVARQSADA